MCVNCGERSKGGYPVCRPCFYKRFNLSPLWFGGIWDFNYRDADDEREDERFRAWVSA